MAYKHIKVPSSGEKIKVNKDFSLSVPDMPIIPYILGDGIGTDVTPAMRYVLDAAVAKAYGGAKSIAWMEVYAGERAVEQTGEWLPQSTLDAFAHFHVGIKGPLTTPVGGGFRSLNVAIRQKLDLYANVRPVYYIPGLPSQMRHPERMNMVLFREATEDVYAGIEWRAGTPEAVRFLEFLRDVGKHVTVNTMLAKESVRARVESVAFYNPRHVNSRYLAALMAYQDNDRNVAIHHLDESVRGVSRDPRTVV